MSISRLITGIVLFVALPLLAVEFPGPQPGPAKAKAEGTKITLENNVILAAWNFQDRGSVLASFNNRMPGSQYASSQNGELFRLATAVRKPEGTGSADENSCNVRILVSPVNVTVLAARGSGQPQSLLTLPRNSLPGQPVLMRMGKLNLQAEPKDYPDPGEAGECSVAKPYFSKGGKTTYPSVLAPTAAPAKPEAKSEWTLRTSDRPGTGISFGNDRIMFAAGANTGAAVEMALPQETEAVGCQIFKGTDRGMSWGPALAVVMDDGSFILAGLRDANTLNITTKAGETLVALPRQIAYPEFNLASKEDFRLVAPPQITDLAAAPQGQRLADRCAGKAIEAEFVNDATGLNVLWRAELRDGSNYIRTGITIRSPKGPQPLTAVELLHLSLGSKTRVVGHCPGSPAASDYGFSGVEMPGSETKILLDSLTFQAVKCQLTATPQQDYSFNAVFGVYPKDQLRRSFLYYLERERARPSSPFLHYNCWYDLAEAVNEKDFLNVIQAFKEELTTRRGVILNSYVIDDGWDNYNEALWQTDKKKFPQGFAPLQKPLNYAGSHLGIWISPLGGYGGAEERTQHARNMGLIPKESGLDLSQPAYHDWFQNRCLELMRDAGVNYFKWDKAGEGVGPHFMALLDVARRLRQENPDLFINVTVGTWPSPFWLNHIDTTWRNGSGDVGWAGVGDDREQWLTYRDGQCYQLFVKKGPLYPLNSVMHHGIVHGRHYQGTRVAKAGADFKHEARSYFGTGAMLQELYLTPSMMTPAAWDQVAEAARFGQAHAATLVDSHWVGGDPLKLEPYGYAAWSRKEAILTLRNPSDKPGWMILDAATVFELPEGTPPVCQLQAAYADQRLQELRLEAGKLVVVHLEPFEVLVFATKGL